ncbi:hypothetical protein BFG07_06525 [Kosakonia cowanii]|nr:hypothetical protein BFG07_06525 [Kosakonia cowanii]
MNINRRSEKETLFCMGIKNAINLVIFEHFSESRTPTKRGFDDLVGREGFEPVYHSLMREPLIPNELPARNNKGHTSSQPLCNSWEHSIQQTTPVSQILMECF